MAKILPLPITQNASTSVSATLQSAAAATGNGTSLPVLGMSSAILTISGTFVGTLIIEGTEDTTNWSTLNARQLGTASVFTSITAPGTYEVSCSGLQNVRARISAYTSGAITVTGHTVPVSSEIGALSGLLKIFNDIWDSTNHVFKQTLASLIAGEDIGNNVLGTIQKPVVSSLYSPLIDVSFGTKTKNNSKNGAGQFLSIFASNTSATVRYLQLHNKASNPAGADVPIESYPIPAGTTNSPGTIILEDTFFLQNGLNFSTGVSWAISTTIGTFTDSATPGDHIVNAHYI